MLKIDIEYYKTPWKKFYALLSFVVEYKFAIWWMFFPRFETVNIYKKSFLNFGMWVEEKQIIKSWKHAKNKQAAFYIF